MSRVITFSRLFPATHPKKGEPTFFVEKIYKSLFLMKCVPNEIKNFDFSIMNDDSIRAKHHTIRSGNRWKVGDKFSPRVWSGKPYRSKQIIIAPDIEIKKVWNIHLQSKGSINLKIYGQQYHVDTETFKRIANNDGLSVVDFLSWFSDRWEIDGQIICWNENINY